MAGKYVLVIEFEEGNDEFWEDVNKTDGKELVATVMEAIDITNLNYKIHLVKDTL